MDKKETVGEENRIIRGKLSKDREEKEQGRRNRVQRSMNQDYVLRDVKAERMNVEENEPFSVLFKSSLHGR